MDYSKLLHHLCTSGIMWLAKKNSIAPSLNLIPSRSNLFIENFKTIRVDAVDGPVVGQVMQDHARFLGIPYAKPPVDSLRWKPPVPVDPRSEAFSASKFGYSCPSLITRERSRSEKLVFDQFGEENEDCLTINVFTPLKYSPSTKGYPVIFFIHGGGFDYLSSASSLHEPGNLIGIQKDVIVVTFNYRLNVFGFLGSQQMTDFQGHDTGNFGLLDQRLAFNWTRRNIKEFGGDPDDIIIAGHSAGSMSIHLQLLMNVKGLSLLDSSLNTPLKASKIMMMSGAIQAKPLRSLSLAKQSMTRLLIATKCIKKRENKICEEEEKVLFEQEMECLRGIEWKELQKICVEKGWAALFAPTMGQLFEDYPSDLIFKRDIPNIPILITHTSDDGSIFAPSVKDNEPLSKKELDKILKKEYHEYFLSKYIKGSNSQKISSLITDVLFKCPAENLYQNIRKSRIESKMNANLYHLEFTGSFSIIKSLSKHAGDEKFKGAFHCSEMFSFFGHSIAEIFGSKSKAKRIQNVLLEFVYTGKIELGLLDCDLMKFHNENHENKPFNECEFWSQPKVDTFPIIQPIEYNFTLPKMKNYDLKEKISTSQQLMDSILSPIINEMEFLDLKDILDLGMDPSLDSDSDFIDPKGLEQTLSSEPRRNLQNLVSTFNEMIDYLLRKMNRNLIFHDSDKYLNDLNAQICGSWIDNLKQSTQYFRFKMKRANSVIQLEDAINKFFEEILKHSKELKDDFKSFDSSIFENEIFSKTLEKLDLYKFSSRRLITKEQLFKNKF